MISSLLDMPISFQFPFAVSPGCRQVVDFDIWYTKHHSRKIVKIFFCAANRFSKMSEEIRRQPSLRSSQWVIPRGWQRQERSNGSRLSRAECGRFHRQGAVAPDGAQGDGAVFFAAADQL
jgi:hypothetical protein